MNEEAKSKDASEIAYSRPQDSVAAGERKESSCHDAIANTLDRGGHVPKRRCNVSAAAMAIVSVAGLSRAVFPLDRQYVSGLSPWRPERADSAIRRPLSSELQPGQREGARAL